ncbi:MAG TPA: hypothetical protein PL037_06890, partial [Elusimicrobiales bacterium]|nr:hypothetical protein [Elusimicrobiales bacterium]
MLTSFSPRNRSGRAFRALRYAALLCFCAVPARALKVELLPAPGRTGVSASGGAGSAGVLKVASGRAFVRFAPETSSGTAAEVLSAAGFSLLETGYPGGWALAGLPEGMLVATALPVLRALPGVSAAEPSGTYRVRKRSSDPGLADQYGFRLTDTFRA